MEFSHRDYFCGFLTYSFLRLGVYGNTKHVGCLKSTWSSTKKSASKRTSCVLLYSATLRSSNFYRLYCQRVVERPPGRKTTSGLGNEQTSVGRKPLCCYNSPTAALESLQSPEIESIPATGYEYVREDLTMVVEKSPTLIEALPQLKEKRAIHLP